MLLITKTIKHFDLKYAIVVENPSFSSSAIFILKTILCTNKPTERKRYRIERQVRVRINRDTIYVTSRIASGKQFEKIKLQVIHDIYNN